MNFTRWIFSMSFAIGMLWLLGFLMEPIGQKEPSIITLSISSLVITIIVSYSLFKLSPNFLKAYPEANISSTKYYIFSIVASYFLLIPIFALVSYLLVRIFGDINHSESGILIGLFAIWFPLWWFVPVGLSIGWFIYKRKCAL
ncbi:hypothetical protein ACFL9T_16035 [Thermodesulfobacteriota bacterium]